MLPRLDSSFLCSWGGLELTSLLLLRLRCWADVVFENCQSSYIWLVMLLKDVLKKIFILHVCFACMYVCVAHACLLLTRPEEVV